MTLPYAWLARSPTKTAGKKLCRAAKRLHLESERMAVSRAAFTADMAWLRVAFGLTVPRIRTS